MHIDREDMLELTRRMTVARNCFPELQEPIWTKKGLLTVLLILIF